MIAIIILNQQKIYIFKFFILIYLAIQTNIKVYSKDQY